MPRPLLFIILLFITCQAKASDDCLCLWQGSFVDAATNADLIVEGTVNWRGGNAMDIAINRIVRGKEFQPTIRVWGQFPGTCRPELSEFEPQTRWLIALEQIDQDVPGGFNPNTPGISFGRVGDYALSACGANWLAVNDGVADGNIIDGPRWQWKNEENDGVIVELIALYLNGSLPRDAIKEAAKPSTEAKKLMRQTLDFLQREGEDQDATY